MPLSKKHEIIFIHVPKTGGESIESLLGVFGINNTGSQQKSMEILYGRDGDANTALQHLTSLEIKEIVGDEVYRAYFKFSFVRNPYDRLVSEYYYAKRIREIPREMSFDEFIHKVVLPNKNTHRHYRDQVDYVTNEKGEVIVDFLGKFEDFTRDLKKILDRLHIKKRFLPYVGSTQRPKAKHYSYYFNDELREVVQALYFKDFEKFGYEFKAPSFIENAHLFFNAINIYLISLPERSLRAGRKLLKSLRSRRSLEARKNSGHS